MRLSDLAICLAMCCTIFPAQGTTPFSYKVRDSKPMKDASVQIVSFVTVAEMNQNAIKKINTALIAASTLFSKEGKECSTYAEDHPWGYELTLQKILVSQKYLSVVFSKSTVCAGSPDIEKEARVFSRPSGDLVPARALFKHIFPKAKLIIGASKNKELIRLDQEMAEAMIDDSREVLKIYDEQCEFFLKNTSYRIWMDGKNAILFPEFAQPESICQKEYLIQPTE